jgi:hypothetical protein
MISKLELPAFPAPLSPAMAGYYRRRPNRPVPLARQHQKRRAQESRAALADAVYAASEPVGKLTTDTLKAEMRGAAQ